jgi:hypothetical protein
MVVYNVVAKIVILMNTWVCFNWLPLQSSYLDIFV